MLKTTQMWQYGSSVDSGKVSQTDKQLEIQCNAPNKINVGQMILQIMFKLFNIFIALQDGNLKRAAR